MVWAYSADRLVIFFLFSRENRTGHFMKIVSNGNNLHEMSNPVFSKNKKNILKCHLLKIFPGLLSVKRWLCCNYKKIKFHHLVFLIHISWNLYQQPFFSRLLIKTHTEEAPLTIILLQQPHPYNSLLYLFPIMMPTQSDASSVHCASDWDQEVVGSIPAGSGKHSFIWMIMKNFLFFHSLLSANSRRAVVSFWRNNVYKYWVTPYRTKPVQV